MGHKKGPQAAEASRILARNLVELCGRVGLSQEATAERAGLRCPGRDREPPGAGRDGDVLLLSVAVEREGCQVSITISAAQRDAIYDDVLTHLSGIDGLWLAIEREDFATADHLGRDSPTT